MLANRTRRRALRAALVLAGPILVALGGIAAAAEPRLIGTFKDWNAFAFEESGNKVCYISSQPKKKEPANVRRGDVYVLVTHRPDERALDVVSVLIGYPFREGSEAAVEVDRRDFALFTDGETAWARDAETDKALAAAMRGGNAMTVKGTSARGTRTTDSYSLAGVSQAYEAINEACGVKR